jgi:hypothetical protein
LLCSWNVSIQDSEILTFYLAVHACAFWDCDGKCDTGLR